MKGVIGLVIVLSICVGLGSSYLAHVSTRDPGHQLGVAFGSPTEETMQIHLGVGPVIPMRDPLNWEGTKLERWSDWVARHFELRDASGTIVPLKKMGTSALLLDDRAGGSPEFALWAELEKEAEYSLDYIPISSESKRYRSSFTVPSEPQKAKRHLFAFVKDTDAAP